MTIDLIARKLGGPEQSILTDADIGFHETEYHRLRGELQAVHEASRLIEILMLRAYERARALGLPAVLIEDTRRNTTFS